MRPLMVLANAHPRPTGSGHLLVLLSGAVTAPTASGTHGPIIAHQANVMNEGIDLVGETFVVAGAPSTLKAFCNILYEQPRVASPGHGLVEVNLNSPVHPGDRFVVVHFHPGYRFVVVHQEECGNDPSRLLLTLEPVN